MKNKQNTDLFWINLPDVVDMYMNYKIKYINAYGGFHDNLWKFNIMIIYGNLIFIMKQ